MYSHADIWNAIDRLAGGFGYSPSGLAKKAGLDPTTFNKSKRISADGKSRWPSTESIAKILAVTGITMAEFFSLTGADDGEGAPSFTIPLIGGAQAGRAGYFDDAGFPQGQGWERITLPLHKSAQELYALKISGNSMRPLYRDGDIVVVEAGSTPRKGDRVVAKTAKGEIMVKELARLSGGKIELSSLNPDHEPAVFKPADILWMARIIWVSQ